jgi:predicted DNA-binding transcriptional regulator YafY
MGIDYATIKRLFALRDYLRGSLSPVSYEDLCGDLPAYNESETSRRMFRRDLEALEYIGERIVRRGRNPRCYWIAPPREEEQ